MDRNSHNYIGIAYNIILYRMNANNLLGKLTMEDDNEGRGRSRSIPPLMKTYPRVHSIHSYQTMM